MSITTYAELKTAVANWAERDDLTTRIPEFIALAEDRIGLDLRVRAMETTGDITLSSQTNSLPTGYLGTRRIYLSDEPQALDYFPPEEFWRTASALTNGRPRIYTIEGDNLTWAPYPSGTSYTGKHLYWAKFTALSSDSDTNWLFTNARGLLLYGSLFELATFLEDDEAAVRWSRLYNDTLARVKASDRRDRHPSRSQMRSEVSKV